ncbi:MAG TPA: OmpA family protein [Saprospiraceae bacterium]|nr:OmpA family protein [Saprospiraceae bacterium]
MIDGLNNKSRYIANYSKSVHWIIVVLFAANSYGQVFDSTVVIKEAIIYFESDSFKIDSIEKITLKSIAQLYRDKSFSLHGHTDGDGSDEYNLNLSFNRVMTAYQFLRDSMNIDTLRIKTEYYGKRIPIAPNHIESGKKLNRRVTIQVTGNRKFMRVRGKVHSDTEHKLTNASIRAESKDFSSEVTVDEGGRFYIDLPYNIFSKVTAKASGHFYDARYIKADPRILKDSIPVFTLSKMINDKSYIIRNLYFVGNQATLLKKSEPELELLTWTMKESDVCVIIEGHVNAPNQDLMPLGTFEYDLAVRRAMSIARHLTKEGIDPKRLNPIGYSNWYMIYKEPESTDEMELNRRVEIVIKECNQLGKYSQKNVVMPPDKYSQKRLHDLQ